MQEHPLEAHAGMSSAARQRLVEGEVAVLRIADHGMAGIGEVDPDLVGAAGLDGHVEQAESGLGREAFGHPHQGDRAPSLGALGGDGADPSRALGVEILVQGDIDHLELFRPGAGNQRRIGLSEGPLGTPRAQVVLQRDQGLARLGDEQQARGLLVEAVH